MAYSREALLKKSIAEFEDRQFNTLVYNTKRITTNSGYTYIIKQPNPKKISCAIHLATSWEVEWFAGKIQNIDVSINTREQIDTDCLIEYQGLDIAITSIEDYNDTMKQWHYRGSTAYGYIGSKFIVKDEKEIEQNLAVDCFPVLFEVIQSITKIPVFPSYFSVSSVISDSNTKCIIVDIDETECVSLLKTTLNTDLTESHTQNNNDRVRISFMNTNTTETYSIFAALRDYMQSQNLLGLVSNPKIYHKKIHQKSFNFKALIHICEFEVNYNLNINPGSETVKVIKDALVSMLKVI